MAKLGRRKVVKVNLETEAGTPIEGTIAGLVYDPEIQATDNMIERTPSRAHGGRMKSERGPSLGTCKFKVELRSDGVDGLDPFIEACLQGCGMKLAGGALAPVTAVADQKTITIDVWEDGYHKQLYGAAGDPTIEGEFGKQCFITFEFQGIFSKKADATLPTGTQVAGIPMLTKAAVLSIGGHTPKVSKFTIKANNKPEAREDITAPEAICHYFIGPDRNYTIELDPEAEESATWDAFGLWEDKTESAFALTLSDGTVDVTIAAPKVQLMTPQTGARDSKLIHNITGQCNADAGDDEITITMGTHTA